MHKAQFDFYVVHSNPSYPETPRLFFVKTLNSKISWAIELDEIQDSLLNTHFDIEEAELWGSLEELQLDGSAKVKLEDKTLEDAIFSEKIAWSLDTLMSENYGIAKYSNQLFAMKPINRDKFQNDAAVIREELRQFRAAANEKLGRKSNHYDLYIDEPKIENLNKKKQKRN